VNTSLRTSLCIRFGRQDSSSRSLQSQNPTTSQRSTPRELRDFSEQQESNLFRSMLTCRGATKEFQAERPKGDPTHGLIHSFIRKTIKPIVVNTAQPAYSMKRVAAPSDYRYRKSRQRADNRVQIPTLVGRRTTRATLHFIKQSLLLTFVPRTANEMCVIMYAIT